MNGFGIPKEEELTTRRKHKFK